MPTGTFTEMSSSWMLFVVADAITLPELTQFDSPANIGPCDSNVVGVGGTDICIVASEDRCLSYLADGGFRSLSCCRNLAAMSLAEAW
eukprot:CAMPEP_0167826708 /NCGR_PEP_ID=MMETSP0112_2-20121227/10209_1 /TAXON_ID=91324 /ORGANISM="Lotharella globosa, Strain CCCM811" /LENGTH=87 /DNA_ID=CAMNT_0007729231 /DNA_START=179 /DNA_END=439 /DNA_ORIENTATION=+